MAKRSSRNSSTSAYASERLPTAQPLSKWAYQASASEQWPIGIGSGQGDGMGRGVTSDRDAVSAKQRGYAYREAETNTSHSETSNKWDYNVVCLGLVYFSGRFLKCVIAASPLIFSMHSLSSNVFRHLPRTAFSVACMPPPFTSDSDISAPHTIKDRPRILHKPHPNLFP